MRKFVFVRKGSCGDSVRIQNLKEAQDYLKKPEIVAEWDIFELHPAPVIEQTEMISVVKRTIR